MGQGAVFHYFPVHLHPGTAYIVQAVSEADTKRPEDVYEAIAEITHHDATLIKGEGCYSKQECDVLYSVVGRDEVNKVVNTVRKTDPQAFVNMIRTENLAGRFYQRPND